MSTRAIIGYINRDGSIVGGWQWFNGDNMAPLLRQQFDNLEKLQELIKYGTWSYIISPRSIKKIEYKEITKDKLLIPVGKCIIVREKQHQNWISLNNSNIIQSDKGIVFPDFLCAYGQDINYLYLFNPLTGKWKTISGRLYKKLEAKLKNIPPFEVINHIEEL